MDFLSSLSSLFSEIHLDYLGMLAGALFSLMIMWSGIGAGVVVVPSLVALFGLEPPLAIATGAAYAFLAKIFMSVAHASTRGVVWPEVLRFLKVCAPIALLASFTIILVKTPSGLHILNIGLSILILCASLFSLAALLSTRVKNHLSAYPGWVLRAATGVIMGFTGVGGGVLVIPALKSTCTLSMKQAVATSIPIGLVLSLLLSVVLGSGGLLDVSLLVNLLIGCVLVMPLGIIAYRFIPERLVTSLVVVLIVAALSGTAHDLASRLGL